MLAYRSGRRIGRGDVCAGAAALTQQTAAALYGRGSLEDQAVSRALAQRIVVRHVVRHHMAALTRDELTAYLAHRLRLAGAELPLFDPAAHQALFQATSGLPRKINLLAHHTLIAAALARATLATADHVQAALPEVA